MNLKRAVIEFAKDVRGFGLPFAVRALLRGTGEGMMTLKVPGFGKVKVRCGDSDYEVVRQTLRNKEYAVPNPAVEQRIADKYQSLLSEGKVPIIVDAGANIGIASIWFNTTFPKAVVVAIEPDPENIKVLKENIADRASNVRVVGAAIGSRPGFVALNNPEGLSWAVQTERAESGCPIISIDEIIDSVENGALFIVKVDIEGFENDLFSENLDWLKQAFAVFIEPHDWLLPGKYTSRSFQKAMASEVFELFLRGENLMYVR